MKLVSRKPENYWNELIQREKEKSKIEKQKSKEGSNTLKPGDTSNPAEATMISLQPSESPVHTRKKKSLSPMRTSILTKSISKLEHNKSKVESEYFFGGKPEVTEKVPTIQFDKVLPRKHTYSMYHKLDGTHQSLFPNAYSANSKIVQNIQFDKITGRYEHGINL